MKSPTLEHDARKLLNLCAAGLARNMQPRQNRSTSP